MPIHDWTRVTPGIFHHFHHEWISTISNALNAGVLPPSYYALAEQIAGGLGPDVLALEVPSDPTAAPYDKSSSTGGISLAVRPPRVLHREKAEIDVYAAKANAVVIRHASNHRVISMIEIVSPGNKNRVSALRAFVEMAQELLRSGIHLVIVDLFPVGPGEPAGLHNAIGARAFETDPFIQPPDKPLTLAAYIGGLAAEAFVEPTAVGSPVAEMPLFLGIDWYVPVPLEATYQTAWNAVPAIWRRVLAAETPPAKP